MQLKAFLHPLAPLAVLASPLLGVPATQLDGAKGHIHMVDLRKRSFELLKETEYDPKTDIGQSRFSVYWNKNTLVTTTGEVKSFAGFDQPLKAVFQGLTPPNRKALKAGRAFEARVVTLYPDQADGSAAEGMAQDENQVVGMFRPDAKTGSRSGTLTVAGKPVPVKLRSRNWRIFVQRRLPVESLAKGFWSTTIHGEMDGDRFVIRRMEVAPLPDPRETDDPKLPRVLVIGDSISMNYDEAARQALKGVANYHRCEGNASSSAHGVRNSELWMGNFNKPGFQWDVIQFNHGLHDLKQTYDKQTDSFGAYAVPLEDYKANLEKQIQILKKSGAKLIWCTTTPVPNDNKGTYARRKGAAKEFNAAAMEVMKRHPEIIVNDLYQVVAGSPLFDDWRKGDNVHFYRETEQAALGAAVAAAVRKALAAPSR